MMAVPAKHAVRAGAVALLALLLTSCADVPDLAAADSIRRWNRIATDASGRDHAQPLPGETRVVREQMGPGRSSRALAIVHIAIFEASNAIAGGYKSYTGLPRAAPLTSLKAAVAQAAHDTLVELFAAQADQFHQELAQDLARIRDGRAKQLGIQLGRDAARAILAMRANDGSRHAEPGMGSEYVPSTLPGKWRMDPVSKIPIALGAGWKACAPFVMPSADFLRAPPPPAIDSPEYAHAFAEVLALGGDGVHTPTTRSEEQTRIGIYWAYDGMPSLGAPPRLYNQIAAQIAAERGADALELARLLALVNVAMADAGIAIWESKYHYEYWRPVTGIREADPGTGPSGLGDNNPATLGDPGFLPLGAPASNLGGTNFTPPFPAYPSGHAGFGAAMFQILRRFYGTDAISFTFVSDEFNGQTRDSQGNLRPLLPRTFPSLSAAEDENGQSRIYLGIHWSFDKTEGINQGRRVADLVFDEAFTRLR